ncbi:MAG: alpha/beta hydrolase [Bacteroidales bacterium]|nr:alpha/beta hydrolase [Bacteroidales bacterium]
MKKMTLLCAFLLVTLASYSQNAIIDGKWWGRLEVGGQGLTIGFEIQANEGKGFLEVKEQGAKGIPMEVKKATPDSLEVSISAIGASYTGVRIIEEKIEGTFSQNGMKLSLSLQPGEIPVNRPQTPQPPYPYLTEEVTFENTAEGVVLSGTLTYPMMHFRYPAGTIPVVLMVTGSGQQNRDEELFGHKPFAVIAHHLALNGIASLRYDDRGVGKSTGSLEGITTQTNKNDAAAGVAYIRGLGKFGKVGVLGHSEGGTIAFMLGADNAVDFLVSLAGSAAKGIDVIVGQNEAALRLSGYSEAVAAQYCRALKVVHTDRVNGVTVENPVNYVAGICAANDIVLPKALNANLEAVVASGNEWFTYFLSYDPSEDIEKISCPVLALNGTLDMQVISKDNIPVIRENLPENAFSQIKEYDSLNHLFQNCTLQNSLLYGAIEETISEEVLNDISCWINSIK